MNIRAIFLSCYSILILLWLLVGCCKSETYYVDQEVKDFTVFQPGSWWVYVDSVSGRRDSVVVTRIQNFIDSEEGDHCNEAETLSVVTNTYYRDSSGYIAYSSGKDSEIDNFDNSLLRNFPPYGGLSADENGTSSSLGHFDRNTNTFSRGVMYDTILESKTVKGIKYTVPELSYIFIKNVGLVRLTNKYKNQDIYLIRYATS